MEMPKSESVKTRIANLLNKAERTDNQSEAEAFYAKAYDLMAKWQVDEAVARATLDKNGVLPDIVVRQHTLNLYKWENAILIRRLLTEIAFGMDYVVRVATYNDNIRYDLIGTNADIDRFVMLADSLMLQCWTSMTRAWNEEMKERDFMPDKKVWTDSYVKGYAYSVRIKMRAALRTVVEETTGAELAVRSVKERIQDWLEPNGYTKSRKSGMRNRDYGAMSKGLRDGTDADIGQTRIGNEQMAIPA